MGLADDDVPCAVISGVGDLAVRVFEGHILSTTIAALPVPETTVVMCPE
jgi:hypothetical protein